MSLKDDIEYLKSRIFELESGMRGVPYFRWATVAGTDPLRVLVDGDAAVLPDTPASLVSGLRVGERVRVEFQNRRATITGRGGTDKSEAVPLTAGYSPRPGADFAPRVLLRNGVVYVTGQIDTTVGAWGTTVTVATLPDWALPPYEIPISVSGVTPYDAWISTSGQVRVAGGSGVPLLVKMNASYPAL